MRALVLTLVVAAFVAASATAAGHPTALPNCLGKPTVRPTAIVLACADANFGVKKLAWIGWGGARAAATGVAYANDCKPYCAAGHFHSQTVELTLDQPVLFHGHLVFSQLTIHLDGPLAPYKTATVTFGLV